MSIGKIEYIDVRKVWPNEASDLTPWLEENPDVLGDLLGLDLDLTKEHPVGAFSLDLNGVDLLSGRRVIIENQLEQSDHRHLGQLLTYAGGVDPAIIIWIAREIREEHRAALDWLNSVTNHETNFFGVVLKAVKIGNSQPAPLLELVAQPNSWTKGIRESSAKLGLSERETAYEEFWSLLISRLEAKYPQLQGRSSWPRAWFPTSTGTSGVNINMVFNRKSTVLECYFGANSEDLNTTRFEKMYANASYFESLVGSRLSWEDLEGRKACRVAINGAEVPNILDRDKWESYISWFDENFAKMSRLRNDKEFAKVLK